MNLDRTEPDGDDDLFQVTAMVDVVFILLAFFVLSVQFHGGERDMTVGHAEAGPPSGAAPEDFPPEIVVRLSRAGDDAVRIQVGDRVVRDGAYEELTALLTEIDMPAIPVVLAADGALSVQDVARGLDAVLMSPMSQVSLSRIETGGTE